MFSKSAILFPLLALFSTALAANHNIRVGPGLTFTPANTNAAVADTLTFTFTTANTHDVVQAAFNAPCSPRTGNSAGNSTGAGAFYSGFLNPQSKFVITVNDTNSIYYFCSAGRHCQNGMVGGVNLPTTGTESLALYIAASARAGESSQPAAVAGGVISPAGDSTNSTSTSTTASSTGTAASATSSPSPTTTNSAGVAVIGNMGGVLGLGALLAAFALA